MGLVVGGEGDERTGILYCSSVSLCAFFFPYLLFSVVLLIHLLTFFFFCYRDWAENS